MVRLAVSVESQTEKCFKRNDGSQLGRSGDLHRTNFAWEWCGEDVSMWKKADREQGIVGTKDP